MEINVGDTVRIVDEPDWLCKAGWDGEMGEFLGMEAKVIHVDSRFNDMFYLDVDNGKWVWSDDLLTKVDTTEFDMKGFSELLRL